jgi:hypothetical protein
MLFSTLMLVYCGTKSLWLWPWPDTVGRPGTAQGNATDLTAGSRPKKKMLTDGAWILFYM